MFLGRVSEPPAELVGTEYPVPVVLAVLNCEPEAGEFNIEDKAP